MTPSKFNKYAKVVNKKMAAVRITMSTIMIVIYHIAFVILNIKIWAFYTLLSVWAVEQKVEACFNETCFFYSNN